MARESSKDREGTQAVEPRRQEQVSRTQPWPSSGPFSMMRRFSDEMDRMFDRVFEGYGFPAQERFSPWTASEVFSPHVDMFERDGKLVISADLPGVKKDDLDVEVTEDAVTIEGERRQERTKEERGYYQSERSYGSFYRSIPLPEGVDPESATAEYKDGVLQIEIPAPERKSRTHKLEIKG